MPCTYLRVDLHEHAAGRLEDGIRPDGRAVVRDEDARARKEAHLPAEVEARERNQLMKHAIS